MISVTAATSGDLAPITETAVMSGMLVPGRGIAMPESAVSVPFHRPSEDM
jgi:hypothetical protein